MEFADQALEYFASNERDVKFVNADVRSIIQLQRAVDFTVDEFGFMDILINNAVAWKNNLLSEITEESWDEIMDFNLNGTDFVIKAVAKSLVRAMKNPLGCILIVLFPWA